MSKLVSRGNGKIDERYRPRRLSEVFGNHSLIKSLNNWFLKGDNRSRVIMLVGTPGSGKTTTARIIATGLNCSKGDSGEPCLECDNCKSILNGTAMNVHELNMAELNKKEDAENLVSEMYDSSLSGRNKIYILDEVQQMTQSSQNLLLKPLEEPPFGTYFVLCTTDPQKIIKPLQTRCQIFKVSNPVGDDLRDYLRQLFENEKWSITKSDADFLKEQVKGCGFREIINISEQFHLGGKDAVEKVAFSEDPEIFELVKYVANGKYDEFVDGYHKIESEKGFDCEGFRMVLLSYLKSMLEKSGMKNANKSIGISNAMDCFLNPYFEQNPIPRMSKEVFKACCFILQN